MNARWHLASPPGAGAIAVFEITGDVDAAFAALRIAPVPLARAALRDLAGIDQGIVARWAPDCAHLMPHGGPAVVRALMSRLHLLGIHHADVSPPSPDPWPEARSRLEARVLHLLARAASPLAIDLLLAQPARWADAGLDPDANPASLPAHAFRPDLDAARARLIRPPLVAALGSANIGKSTLVNHLAGRRVSVVADEPGTTRDYVGANIDLAGLVVHFFDTPGLRGNAPYDAPHQAPPEERWAIRFGLSAAKVADLVLACGDPHTPPPLDAIAPGRPVLKLCLRADLGEPDWPADARVSALTGQGIEPLVAAIRDALVPPRALVDPAPWRLPKR